MMSNVDTGNSFMVFGDDEANFKTLAPAGQASRGPLEHTPLLQLVLVDKVYRETLCDSEVVMTIEPHTRIDLQKVW